MTSEPSTGTADGALPPGTLVAERYRIERSLGEGGMGAVYLAEHVAMRKAVALKVLHASTSKNSEVVQRFEREAVAAASIDHQHVASATDFGALPDGSFFLVLEYVQGRSLRDELAAGALSPARSLGIMRGIVAGVAAAHSKGIVHRDLKPENVMLTQRDGNPDFVKVLDFGIAKMGMEEEAAQGPTSRPLTRIGTIMGTPNYMSPEQAVGQPCDHRADLYALGIVFYEMLTGSAPFEGDAVVVLAAHVTTPAPPLPDDVLAVLGPDGQAVLDQLLAKTPDGRYQSALDLAAALDVLAMQVSPPPPMSMRSARSLPDGALPDAAPSARVIHSSESGAVVTAPTQMAMPTPASPSVSVVTAPSLDGMVATPDPRAQRLMLVGGGAVATVGVVVLLVFALRGSATPDPSGAPAPSASASDSVADLPPLPASAEPAPAPSAAKEAAKPAAGKGGKTAGKGRKTGPGGIYIPPLKSLFK